VLDLIGQAWPIVAAHRAGKRQPIDDNRRINQTQGQSRTWADETKSAAGVVDSNFANAGNFR
jgi:hypothetical protein